MLEFDEAEKAAITRCSIKGGWDLEEAEPLKSKIRTYLLSPHDKICCYCYRSMANNHRMTIDTEHILPKKFYPKFLFNMTNLSLACKRCNMSIKGERTDFLTTTDFNDLPFESAWYAIVHPNVDRFSDHIEIRVIQVNNIAKTLYSVKTAKGKSTYDYFRLSDIDDKSFDELQGILSEEVLDSFFSRGDTVESILSGNGI